MLPNLFHLGHLTLPTFGLLTALGLMAALSLSLSVARRSGLEEEKVWNAGLFAVIAAFALSRLILVATNFASFRAYPILLLMVPSLTPLGLVLTAAATAVWLWARGLPTLRMLDVWAPCGTLLWAFLAMGHFAEGSDPGLPAARFGLPIRPGGARLYPVALLATLLAVAGTLFVLWWSRRRERPPGQTAALALALTGVAQFLLTFLREPYPYEPPFTSPLDPIQWLALGMIIAGAMLSLSGTLAPRSRKEVSHAI